MPLAPSAHRVSCLAACQNPDKSMQHTQHSTAFLPVHAAHDVIHAGQVAGQAPSILQLHER